MFKRLLELYIQNRINEIDKEIESLAKIIIEEEDTIKTKSIISQAVFEFKPETTKRIRQLSARVNLYNLIFAGIEQNKINK